MRKIVRIRRKLALIAAGIVGLSIATLGAVTPSRAGNQSFVATINGPATVLTGYTCTWTSATNISNPNYEWSVTNGTGTTIIGTSSSVSYAFNSSDGPHQALDLRVYNLAGDEAWDGNLIGVYYVGSPDCP